MKKILYATTAIAAVSAISAANAQESAMMSAAGNDLSIGGYYEFGYASRSDDRGGDDGGADSFTYGDSELYIDFETTSDAGLTYGVQLDFEVVNGNEHAESGDAKNAEESSIYVSGNFGTIHLGHDDYASDLYNVWAPTHEGAFSQYDSINGLRYSGEGAVLRVIDVLGNNTGADNQTAIATARANFLAGGQFKDPADEDEGRESFVDTSDIPGLGTRSEVMTALNSELRGEVPAMSSDFTTEQRDAALAAATTTATALVNGAFVDDAADSTQLRGLQQDVNLAYTASWTQGNDDAKITYVSPNLGGLSFGGSFADSDSSENSPTAFGGSFTGSVDRIPFVGGGFSYKLAAWQYGNGGDDEAEVSTTHLGVNIGIGDLTLTAAQLSGDISETTEDEVETLELGVGYAVHDALSVGFSTADASNDDTDEEGSFQSVSLSYTIAPGLKTTAAYNFYDVERDDAQLLENSGTELVWQVEFAF